VQGNAQSVLKITLKWEERVSIQAFASTSSAEVDARNAVAVKYVLIQKSNPDV